MMGGVPTWVPSTCPVCGGLRDGEGGPPWPFHAKGFHACECDDDGPVVTTITATSTAANDASGGRDAAGDAASGDVDLADSP